MASFIWTLFVLFVSWLIEGSYANIVLQSAEHCGTYKQPKEQRILEEDELEVYSHTGKQFYAPNADCIVTIIGKTYHQWEVTILNLDIDGHECDRYSPCCNDYLKIFSSYRVDNARLFPTIPWRGFCGEELPQRRTFMSKQNYITIQFNSDIKRESKRGFQLRLKQFERRNSGTDTQETGFIGGWNDGTLSELQIDWSAQEVIPGDYRPGQLPDFEYDANGVPCYVCQGCDKEYFDSDHTGISVQEGCFVCTKEFIVGTGSANRDCLSRNQFRNKLMTFRDNNNNFLDDTQFRDCRTLSRGTDTVNYVTLCVCDTGKCNAGTTVRSHWSTMLALVMVLTLTTKWIL